MSDIYAAYTLDMTEAQVRAAYAEKYGEPPAEVNRFEAPTKMRGKPFGYWYAGPLPENSKGKVIYG